MVLHVLAASLAFTIATYSMVKWKCSCLHAGLRMLNITNLGIDMQGSRDIMIYTDK